MGLKLHQGHACQPNFKGKQNFSSRPFYLYLFCCNKIMPHALMWWKIISISVTIIICVYVTLRCIF